jgi:cytochrome bd ubiquinol oxidase subunit II
VYPVMLRSTVEDAYSLTAVNALSPGAGPGSGVIWFMPALLLAVGYFLFILRMNPGKAQAGPEH